MLLSANRPVGVHVVDGSESRDGCACGPAVNEMASLYQEGASLKNLAGRLRRRGRNNTKPACGVAGTTTSPWRAESTC